MKFNIVILFSIIFSNLSFSSSNPIPKNNKNVETFSQFNVCGKLFNLEVAKNSEQRSRGMMYRKELKENNGMIFVFREASEQSFWMKNVIIPLDILFFNSSGVLVSSQSMQPESPLVQDSFLKRYESKGISQFVVELQYGSLKKFEKSKKLKDCKLSPLPNIDDSVKP